MKKKKNCAIVILLLTLLLLCLAPEVSFAAPSSTSNFGRYLIDTQKLKSMRKRYEVSKPDFAYAHAVEKPISTWKAPRYKLGKNGIYSAPGLKKDDVAVIMLTGDLMCQSNQQKAARKSYGKYRFNDNFYYVKSIFSQADLVVGNLETTLSESASYMCEEHNVDGHPNCNAPSTYLDALRYAGFDLLMCANNHNCDAGLKGIYQTIGHMNQYGFMHTGLFEDDREPRFVIVKVDGIKIGFLSYSTYYNARDAYFSPEGRDIFLNKYSAEKVQRDVAAAKAAGAEYIIAYNHWGIEYQTTKDDSQTKMAQEMADAGVDFIVGSHPHVLQQYDTVYASSGKKVHVMYSMGNFVSHMKLHDECKDSLILRLKIQRNSDGKPVLVGKCYIPCRCMTTYNGHNYTAVPITRARRTSGKDAASLQTSYKRIQKLLGSRIAMIGSYK